MILVVVAVVLSGCNLNDQNRESISEDGDNGKAVITFEKEVHDFGEILQGEKVSCIFTYVNEGDTDLVITGANASCGCTVPKFSKKPLKPGEKERIEVVFDSEGRAGKQAKTVTIVSNAENRMVRLRLTANIIVDN